MINSFISKYYVNSSELVLEISQSKQMQAQQDHKETNEARFQSIDKRWSVVEDAFRIQTEERTVDLSILKHHLKQRNSQVSLVQQRKGQIIGQTLKKLNQIATQSKENVDNLFQTEAAFRVDHLEKKNQFIKNFLSNGSSFNSSLQQYATNKIKDVCNKIQAIDSANRSKTEETVKQIKKEFLAETQANFQKQKMKFTELFGKVSSETNKQLDQLRDLLKEKRKKREQSQAKLRLMISSLVQELSKLSETQIRQGQITYDCLLKLLEECCAKIQQAQLK